MSISRRTSWGLERIYDARSLNDPDEIYGIGEAEGWQKFSIYIWNSFSDQHSVGEAVTLHEALLESEVGPDHAIELARNYDGDGIEDYIDNL